MKKYRIDKTKNIGNVIFVVEGGRPETGGTELRLLKKIFADILGYEVQEWIMDLEALGIHSYDLDDLAQTQKTLHCR